MYSHLVNKFPGIVVPPVPEKMAIGRFNEDFIQSRKNALETFCQKLLRHPYLQTDADVRIFLESADFAAEVTFSLF
jgi:sorting nexin-1/2